MKKLTTAFIVTNNERKERFSYALL